MRDIQTTFQGEVMLAGWRETHNGGATVTFWLPDAGELDVFRGLTVRKGNTAGQRFMAVLVEVGDDERPRSPMEYSRDEMAGMAAEERAADAVEARKGGSLAKLAGMMCADPKFRAWFWSLNWMVRRPDGGGELLRGTNDVEGTAQGVRLVCRVGSRAELDHDPEAAQRFHDSIRKPWAVFNERKS